MRDKRTYAYHLRLQPTDKQYILYEIIYCLTRTTNHNARPCLETYFFERTDTLYTVVVRHFRRVKLPIVSLAVGLVPQ